MILKEERLHFFERIFTIIVLILLTRVLACDSLFFPSEGDLSSVKEFSPLSFILVNLLSLSYIISFILLIFRSKRSIITASKSVFLCLILLLALSSVFWSDFPEVTLQRSIVALGTTLFGVYVASRYTLKEQVQFLGWALGFALIFNIIYTLLLPGAGIESGVHAGAWRGALIHKNVLGRQMALTGLTFVLLAFCYPKWKILFWLCCILSIIGIIMSGSTSSLGNFFIFLFLLYLVKSLRLKATLFIPLSIIGFLLGSALLIWFNTNADTIAATAGKDLTLTGRTEIWDSLFRKISLRPLLGYGFEAFWWGKEVTDVWNDARGFKVDNAHNGFIQLTLDLGLLGLGLFMVDCIKSLIQSILLIPSTKGYEYFFPFMCLSVVLLTSQTEIGLLQQHSILWFLYVSTTLSIGTRNFYRINTS